MIKQLLSVAALASMSAGAYADLHEVDSYVFSNNARYKITGANLVTNGTFSEGADGFSGWNAINAEAAPLTSTFLKNEGMGPDGTNTAQVQAGATALDNGMYQVIPVSVGGTYVVSMKVMNTAGAGFTDLDFTGGNTNYINAFYNTDGALGGVTGTNNTTLTCGENGVMGGYGFAYKSDAWTEVVFAINAPAEGNIVIELAGMAENLEIAQIECHAAEQVFDTRIPQRAINYYKTIFNGFDFDGYDYYEDLGVAIEEMEAAIASNNDAQMETFYQNLTGAFADFAAENLSNVLNTINGGQAADNSANWDNWTRKFNKMSSDATAYSAVNGWGWTTDRWCHKNAATNTPLQIQWMRGSSGTWDNIAYNTTKLSAGTYYFGVSGEGGMMTLNKQRWARSLAQECAETQMFFDKAEAFKDAEGNIIFGGDQAGNAGKEQFVNYFSQIDTLYLNPSYSTPYLYKFVVENDDTDIIFGIRCNLGLGHAATDGFDVNFTNPVIYKVLEKGKLTPEQETYLSNVDKQMGALADRIEVAKGLIAEDQTAQPWGKEELKAKMEEAQKRYDAFAAIDQAKKLEIMDNGVATYEATDTTYTDNTLADVIMNAGVRYINNEGITPFNNLNAPLTDMPGAVQSATATMNERIYSGCDNSALKAAIDLGDKLYKEGLVAPYSEETAQGLVDQKAAIAAAVDAFVASLVKKPIVNIDFGTQEAPAEFVEHVDESGETETYYTLAGAKGEMVFNVISAKDENGLYKESTSFQIGYNNTDSLGMIRVGNGEGSVALNAAPTASTNIISVEFDLYFGNLKDKKCGYKLLTEAGDTICGLYCSKYSNNDDLNTFGVDYGSKINAVGSSSASNAAIAAESNRTHFQIILDYGTKKMYCTTSGSKGTVKTAELDFDTAMAIAKFVVYSDYNNQDRRSWFDNLLISEIECGAPTAVAGVAEAATEAAAPVKAVENGQVVIKTAKGTFNAAGAQVK